MKYIVEMNGSYMNSFKKYGDARELADRLQRQFPKNNVKIVEKN